MRYRFRDFLSGMTKSAVLGLLVGGGITGASAATFKVLHHFTDKGHQSRLAFGPQGALYGVTEGALGKDAGRVFSLTPPAPGQHGWTYRVLHAFGDELLGMQPRGQLVFDEADAIFGVTSYGGAHYRACCNAGGTVYRLSPSRKPRWTHELLTSFGANTDDGHMPYTGVIRDASGALYGTTFGGGAADLGTVFAVTPPASGSTTWGRTLLHAFGPSKVDGTDGAAPEGTLTLMDDGALYGTTRDGGSSLGNGTFFRIRPPLPGKTNWRHAVLKNFFAGLDGAYPHAGLAPGKGGALYGMTNVAGDFHCGSGSGCGTIVRLKGTTLTTLHMFAGGAEDGMRPFGDLTIGKRGELYGTTGTGGAANRGTVFMLAPPPAGESEWVMTILYDFALGPGGNRPYAGLVPGEDGWFYGTTERGGAHDRGTVFALKR